VPYFPSCALSAELSLLSATSAATAWWKSKTALIKQLKQEVSGQSERKLTELHKINNSVVDRIEGLEAKLGGFVRWTLGLEGGVEELLKGGEGGDWVE
jgi:TolA-binding protein